MKRFIFFVFLFFCSQVYAEVTVSFEPKSVSLGESVSLVVTSDEPIKGDIDLTPLQSDFIVSGRQQRLNTSVVNGRVRQQYQLIYNLFPKKNGVLTVSSLSVSGQKMAPITLSVGSGSSENGSVDQGVFELTGSLNKKEVYVGEPIIYTVVLDETIGVMEGEFVPPQLEGASVYQYGQDQASHIQKNGETVTRRQVSFMLIPEKEGSFTIKPAQFYGRIPNRQAVSRRSFFNESLFDQGILFDGFQSRQKEVFAEAQPQTIVILPKPSDWQGWWLPSSGVQLTSKDQISEPIHVGDTLQRELVLTVNQADSSKLPIIRQPETPDLKIYPSPEQRDTRSDPSVGFVGIEKVSVLMVPQQAGEIEIPAVQVPWFNTLTKTREIAVVPAKKIKVLPSGTSLSDGNEGATGDAFKNAEETTLFKTESKENAPKNLNQKSSLNPEEKTFVQEEEKKTKEASKSMNAEGSLEKRDDSLLTKTGTGWLLISFGTGALLGAIVGVLGFAFWKRRQKKQFLKSAPKSKKKKKPLPDLYPF